MKPPSALAERALDGLARHHLALGAACGAWLLTVSAAPLYTVSGAYEGYVALSWYTVTFHGSQARLEALDAVRIVSIAPLSLAVYLLAVQPLIARMLGPLALAEASVGGALAFLATGFSPAVLARYVSWVARAIEASLVSRSSAGLIWLGEATVAETPILALASVKVYALLSLAYLVAAIAALDRALQRG